MKKEKMAPLMSLSDLPDNVIDGILSRLPTKDAGRTAVLSRFWRHRWRSIPDLDLSAVSDLGVSQALRLHVGPIRLFKFEHTDRRATDSWLAAISSTGCLHTLELSSGYCRPLSLGSVARFFPRLAHLRLAGSSISMLPERDSSEFAILQTLHLDRVCCASYDDEDQDGQLSMFVPACPLLEILTVLMCGFPCILNSMARDYPRLTHLQLSIFPNFIIPSSTSGLTSLRTLNLFRGTILGDLTVLFALCPLLENLTLKRVVFIGGKCLGVVAPNLRFLKLVDVAKVGDFSIEDAPVLETAIIDICLLNPSGDGEASESCNLIKILGGMLCIQRLHLSRRILMFLAKGYVPENLPVSFDHLRYMLLKPDLDDIRELRVILCLLRSSPNLQELDLENCPDKKFPGVGKEFWKAQEHLGLFENLERVKVTNYYPLEAEATELEFVQFVLSKARVLKTMVVSFPHEPMRKRLLMSPRVSNQAKIIFT